jgi:putative transposase
MLVNHKKAMRLMREHGLTVRLRRRFVATTDSDHDGPIFPNLAKDVLPTGPMRWLRWRRVARFARG